MSGTNKPIIELKISKGQHDRLRAFIVAVLDTDFDFIFADDNEWFVSVKGMMDLRGIKVVKNCKPDFAFHVGDGCQIDTRQCLNNYEVISDVIHGKEKTVVQDNKLEKS